MTKEETQKLVDVISRIVELRGKAIKISPSWIATEVMTNLDPKNVSPRLVWVAAHLEIRQLARGNLRKRFEDDEDVGMDDMFPDLQARYPTAHSEKNEEREYILRDKMSKQDIAYNVQRLRKEGEAKLRHADALEAFGRGRRRTA